MKKIVFIRPAIIVMLLFVLLAFTVVPSMAAEGQRDGSIGLNPDLKEDGNLLSSMGSMLPGDTHTDYAILTNRSVNGRTFFVVPYAEGHKNSNTSNTVKTKADELLDILEMKVTVYDGDSSTRFLEGGIEVYNGPASQTKVLGQEIELKYLSPGSSCIIEITVYVPTSINNEFDGVQGKFHWVFLSYGDEKETGGGGNGGGGGIIPKPDPDPEPETKPGTKPGGGTDTDSGTDSGYTPDPELPTVEESTTPAVEVATAEDLYVIDEVPIPDAEGQRETGGGVLAATEPEPTASEGDKELTIIDQMIPMIDFTGNGGWSLLNLILSILTLSGAIFMIYGVLKSRKEENNEDSEQETIVRDEEMEKEQQRWYRNYRILRLLSIIFGIAPIICFIILEDFSEMQFLSRWTPLIVLLVIIDVVIYVIMKFHGKEAEFEESDEQTEPIN